MLNKSSVSNPREVAVNVRNTTLKKFDPRAIKHTTDHTFDLFTEVANIVCPPMSQSKRPRGPHTAYIISVYKVFDGDDSEKFEKHWLYWTGQLSQISITGTYVRCFLRLGSVRANTVMFFRCTRPDLVTNSTARRFFTNADTLFFICSWYRDNRGPSRFTSVSQRADVAREYPYTKIETVFVLSPLNTRFYIKLTSTRSVQSRRSTSSLLFDLRLRP